MTLLSNQEIFDKALFGIRSQNYQQSRTVLCEGGSFQQCAYRGSNGTKCVVGHCISDEHANLWDSMSGLGGSSIKDIFTSNKTKVTYFNYFTEDQLEFLLKLQFIHDIHLHEGSGTFEFKMHEIACTYGLSYSLFK